jgi:phosphate-selective porin OprO/OprP
MMNFKQKTIPALIAPIFLGLSLSTPALANDSDELEKLRALVQDLEQKVKIIDRKNEIAEETAAAKKKDTPTVKASEKGFGIQSADGQHEIRFRGLLQADGREFLGGTKITQQAASGASTAGYLDNTEEAKSTYLLRRIRPTVEGTVFGKYDFRFTPEFGDGKSQVIDAYLDARLDPSFKIRAGKFKPFVGLERLQSGADIKFIERSYVSSILPNRDLGVSVYGDILNNKLSYAVGAYNGVVDGGDSTTSSDLNNSKDFAARIFASPFNDQANALSGLSFGIAGTYGSVTGDTRDTVNGSITELTSGYRTDGQQLFFQYNGAGVLRSGIGENGAAATSELKKPDGSSFGTKKWISNPESGLVSTAGPGPTWLVHADGRRYRFSPQFSYYYGPLGVLGEWVRESQEISVGKNNLAKTTLNNDAFQLGFSWLLTGEDASFKGVKPKNNFDLNSGGWGAWELVARWQEINIDKDAFAWGNLSGGAGVDAVNGNFSTLSTGSTASGLTTATLLNANHYLYADPKASARSAKTWTAGVNWYLNPEVKFALNYSVTSFDGGGGSLAGSDGVYYADAGGTVHQNNSTYYDLVTKGKVKDREDERVILARFQIAF